MKSFSILAIAAWVLALVAGCTGDPLTTDNGAPKKAVVIDETVHHGGQTCSCSKSGTYCQVESNGASLHCELFTGGCATDGTCKVSPTATKFNSCPSGQVWQGSTSWTQASSATFTCVAAGGGQCIPHCTNNCRDNGCGGTCPNLCSGDETCTQSGMCVPTNAECWFLGGILCYPNGGLSITCKKFKPGCGASTTLIGEGDLFSDTCDDGNANTQDSVMPKDSLAFNGWDVKEKVCVHTANGGGGGQQVPNSATCRVRPVSTGMAWLGVHGGGAASTSFTDIKSAPWQNTPVAPSGTGGWASVSVESQPFAAVLPRIESSKWSFGAKDGYTLPQNNGDWQVQCDGLPTVTFTNSTPLCAPGVSLSVGAGCRWYYGNDYRFVVRLH